MLLQRVITVPGSEAFDVEVRDAAELGAADYDSLVSTPPLMNDRRIVVLKNVPAVSAEVRDMVKATLAAAPATLCLVGTGGATMRGTLYDEWEKRGARVVCELPRKFDFARWLTGRAKADFGKKLDRDAAGALAEIGAELGPLYAELEKAALYAGEQEQITRADVEAVCSGGRVGTVWEWCDAVGAGDAPRALSLLKELLDAGESAYRLVPLLATHFCRLGVVVGLGSSDPGRIQAALPGRTWPAMARALAAQARRHTPESVTRALDLLTAADLMLKSTGHGEEFVMHRYLLPILDDAA
ncbi:hypothetical protein BH18GEM1_BH18GEM1_07650 [soil metagenome]